MEKIIKNITVLHKIKYGKPFTFKEIKDLLNGEVKEGYIIFQGYDEGYESSDSGMDSHYYLDISEKRLETDEEFQERLKKVEEQKRIGKIERRKLYEKLKKEFENEN